MTDGRGAFAALLNCIDGRAQLPALEFVRNRFGVDHVDNVTEAGIVRYCSVSTGGAETVALQRSIDVSLNAHGSRQIAVAAHHDCAGNPVTDTFQRQQLLAAVTFLKARHPDLEVIGVWIDEAWKATEV